MPRSASSSRSAGRPSSATTWRCPRRPRRAWLSSTGSRCSAPIPRSTRCLVATFTVAGLHHALVAARLSVEYGIGVRHGCFCAHPYLLRLLDLTPGEVADYHAAVRAGDRRAVPGAVRASAGLSTSTADIDLFLAAVSRDRRAVRQLRSTMSRTHTPGTSGRPATCPRSECPAPRTRPSPRCRTPTSSTGNEPSPSPTPAQPTP